MRPNNKSHYYSHQTPELLKSLLACLLVLDERKTPLDDPDRPVCRENKVSNELYKSHYE